MQTIQDLEARALRRADDVDELYRLLRTARSRRQARTGAAEGGEQGLWAWIAGLFMPGHADRKIEALEQELNRKQAALRIAVDALHQEHCARLRAAPWSRTLLNPTEAELRDANDEYHPWNRVLMAGKRAIAAFVQVDEQEQIDAVISKAALAARVAAILLTRSSPGFSAGGVGAAQIDSMNRAGDAVQSFVNSLQLLAKARPAAGTPAGSPELQAIADQLKRVRTAFGFREAHGRLENAADRIRSLMAVVAKSAGGKFEEVENASDRLEEVNAQIALAAWSKIPARLRPFGR